MGKWFQREKRLLKTSLDVEIESEERPDQRYDQRSNLSKSQEEGSIEKWREGVSVEWMFQSGLIDVFLRKLRPYKSSANCVST
jgi:hypothetical protein